ncbi:MAG: hypothetical protein PF448_06895 [Bacteroidales bacterium]|jgi:hypothetical protein|nr:hypothetical protein [Bacteroidales bacterium]
MKRHYILLIIYIFCFVFNSCSQNSEKENLNSGYSSSQEKSIKKPSNISESATLFLYNAKGDQIPFWVEYAGVVDSINSIHNIVIYNREGGLFSDNYYLVIKGPKSFRVDSTCNYSSALSRVIGIKSEQDSITLLSINYYGDKNIINNDFMLISSVKYNKNAPDICPLSPNGDIEIKLKSLNHLIKVGFVNMHGDIVHRYYILRYKNKIVSLNDYEEKIKVSYYNSDNQRIYLLNQQSYLDRAGCCYYLNYLMKNKLLE